MSETDSDRLAALEAEVARLRAAADRWRADCDQACRILAKLRCRTWEDRTPAEWAELGRKMAGLKVDEGGEDENRARADRGGAWVAEQVARHDVEITLEQAREVTKGVTRAERAGEHIDDETMEFRMKGGA